MLSEKYKKDLDKLVNIAKNYRDGTLSNSLFIDVMSSQENFGENIELCKEYLRENRILVVDDADEVEEAIEEVTSNEEKKEN